MALIFHKENSLNSLGSWFKELAELARLNNDSTTLPKLEFTLWSGYVVEGYIVKVQQNIGEQVLIVLDPSQVYSNSEVSIVFCNEIKSLQVVEWNDYLQCLTGPPAVEEQDFMELERVTKKIEKDLEKYFLEKISLQLHTSHLDDLARMDVQRILEMLPSTFSHLDSVKGRLNNNRGLNTAIREIAISVSDTPRTTLNKQILDIQICSPLKLPHSLEKGRLLKDLLPIV